MFGQNVYTTKKQKKMKAGFAKFIFPPFQHQEKQTVDETIISSPLSTGEVFCTPCKLVAALAVIGF